MKPVAFAIIAFSIVVFGLDLLFLNLVAARGQASLVWPTNGLVLAVALRLDPKRLWQVLTVAVIAMVAANLADGGQLVRATEAAVANLLEVGVAVLALRRILGVTPDLFRFRDLMVFSALAAAAPLVSAAFSTFALSDGIAGHESRFFTAWWLADALGLMIVTPALLLVQRRATVEAGRPRPAWMAPLAVLAVVLVSLTNMAVAIDAVSIAGLAILALIGAEFGASAAALALLAVSVAAIARRILGGQVADLGTEQAWLAAQSIVVLALSSLMAEQRHLRAELARRLGQSEAERLAVVDAARLARLAGAVAEIGYWRTDFRTGETTWSEEMFRILGVDPVIGLKGMPIIKAIQTIVAPVDQPRMFQVSEALRREGKAWEEVIHITRVSDAAPRILALQGEPELDEAGKVVGVLCVGRDITDEAAARKALEQSEERYRLVTEHIHDPVLHLRLDGEIRFVSTAVRRFGYEPQDLIGQNAARYVHPHDLPGLASFLDDIKDLTSLDGLVIENEFRIRRADGVYIWVEGNPALMFDGDGKVDGYVNGLRDVTSRREAESALQESEARYRILAEASPDLVVRYDRDLKLEYVSPRVTDYGYDPEALIGAEIRTLIHPDDWPQVCARVLEGIAAGRMDDAADRTHRIVTATGDEIWVESRPALIHSPTGEPIAVLAQIRDITERRRQLQEIADSNLRYRTIAERVTDIIALTELNGRFRYVSPSITAATGYTPEELVGDFWARHVHPDDVEVAQAAYLDLIKRGDGGAEIRYRVRRRSGGWVWLEARPVVLRDPQGRLEGFLDVIRDASRQVELETELRAARDAAERAALAKSEFLANMSHEIRTPLTAVLGFVGVMADRSDLSAASRLDLDRIDHAGRTLLSIVNDILELSKLEAGQVRIHRTPTDVRRLVADLVDMLAPQGVDKGLCLHVDIADDLPAHLSIDADRVRQVMVNLVGNAIKFTDEGSVDVVVAWDPVGARLAVKVRDTGPGLDDGQKAVLFQRFSQVDSSSARRQGGAGLGLAICRGLVDAMDGDIGVDSMSGAGACFYFDVPAVACAPAVTPVIEAPVLDGVRILVVDDNASNRDLALRVFSSLGFAVDLAAGGQEGVSACRSCAYDLILMDIRMPVVDGPAAARMIRETCPLNGGAPILAFTADVDAGLEARFPGLFQGIIRKPLEMAQMLAVISRALASETSEAEASLA